MNSTKRSIAGLRNILVTCNPLHILTEFHHLPGEYGDFHVDLLDNLHRFYTEGLFKTTFLTTFGVCLDLTQEKAKGIVRRIVNTHFVDDGVAMTFRLKKSSLCQHPLYGHHFTVGLNDNVSNTNLAYFYCYALSIPILSLPDIATIDIPRMCSYSLYLPKGSAGSAIEHPLRPKDAMKQLSIIYRLAEANPPRKDTDGRFHLWFVSNSPPRPASPPIRHLSPTLLPPSHTLQLGAGHMEEQICILCKMHEDGRLGEFFFHFVELDPIQSQTQMGQLTSWCRAFFNLIKFEIICCDATRLATVRPTTTPALAMFYTFIAGPWTNTDICLAAANVRALWLISFAQNLDHVTGANRDLPDLLKAARFGGDEIDLGGVKSGTSRKGTSEWIFLSPLLLHNSCSLIQSLPSSPTGHQLKGVKVEAFDMSKLLSASYERFVHAVLGDRDGLGRQMFSTTAPKSRTWTFHLENFQKTLHLQGFESDQSVALSHSSEVVAEVYLSSHHVLGRPDEDKRREFLGNLHQHPTLATQGKKSYSDVQRAT